MKISHRKMLIELMGVCNQLGGVLDGTSTSEKKYIDRQRAHMLVYKILYGILMDRPENDHREEDLENAANALKEISELAGKHYKDRNGN